MSDEEEKRRWRPPPASGGPSGRSLKQRVTAKGTKSPSSRAWLERQLNDPYVRRAQEEGYRARAAFKLLELDERFGLLRKGARAVDLGAAPGGWAQVCVKRGLSVVGIDLLPVAAVPGAMFLEGDFLDEAMEARLLAALAGPADLVLSDMAANTTGHARTDQLKTGALAEAAAAFALKTLAPGGAFVTKAFQGGVAADLLADLKRRFAQVRHAKPPASRAESAEVYLVAQGFRPED